MVACGICPFMIIMRVPLPQWCYSIILPLHHIIFSFKNHHHFCSTPPLLHHTSLPTTTSSRKGGRKSGSSPGSLERRFPGHFPCGATCLPCVPCPAFQCPAFHALPSSPCLPTQPFLSSLLTSSLYSSHLLCHVFSESATSCPIPCHNFPAVTRPSLTSLILPFLTSLTPQSNFLSPPFN